MPLQENACQQRRERLLAQTDADLIVISNPSHVLYFSGYWSTPLHIGSQGGSHLLIDGKSGSTTLLVHDFAPDAQSAYVDEVALWHWYDAATDAAPPLFPTMLATLNHRLSHQAGRVAIESGSLPHGILTTPTVDITPTILAMRRQKYPDELALLRGCVAAVEAGHRAAREAIRPGVTEIDVYNAICAAAVATAGEPVLPLGDFVSGERAFKIGGAPTARVLQPGDVMIVDLFPLIDGYRADFTATYAVSERLTEAQQTLEVALHAALAAGERELTPGAKASTIYTAVKDELDQRGYAGAFPHHAGHGLGLGHPEAPYFVPGSDETLQTGDVVTLEPGAYGADFGGRIEHNYLITDSGFERLSHHDTRYLSDSSRG